MKIGIFQDTNGGRHALSAGLYKEFKASQYWLAGYKHITYTERTDLEGREAKALTDAVAKVAKIGMFDLVRSGWTLQGDLAFTEKQVTSRKKVMRAEIASLRSWERSMKQMDMLPSAAGAILGKLENSTCNT